MEWLQRLLRLPEPQDAPGGRERIRAGIECELRGELPAAEEHYRAVQEGDPARPDALFFLGRIALADQRSEEAIALLEGAAQARPDEALYWMALGEALYLARRFGEAVAAYERARLLQPEPLSLAVNYAAALAEVNRREEARAELEKMRDIASCTPEVHFNLGGIYREYCRTQDAIAAYRAALALRPDHAATYSNLLLELNMDATLSASEIFLEHRRFGERFARRAAPPLPDRRWPRRLRIGYVSPDFRAHVVSFFMEPILAHHDRSRFEVFCYHVHGQKDRITDALRALAEHWRDVEELSDAQLAQRIREDRIDILVDLAGHTGYNRLPVFAEKPAPVQATYLGYPNTTGLAAIDYRITDAVADPPGEADLLSVESLIRLPGSYFCYRPGPDAPAVDPPPALASGAITFGCFSHFAKVSKPYLDTVARLLRMVPGSRFLLKGRPLSIPAVAERVHRHFADAGIEPDRVEIRGWEATTRSHLRMYSAVDIALDTFPYGAATTACEALWMGVPIVTVAGERHAGRMCASILTAVGLTEWIARDLDDYVAKACALAADVGRLAALRRELRDRVQASPLRDEAAFTRNLERAYEEMWKSKVLGSGSGVPRVSAPVAARLERARELGAQGHLAAAEELVREILREQPTHEEALALLWDIGFRVNSPGVCVAPLLEAIEKGGESARLQYMLGSALQALGTIADAEAAFRRAVELDPAMAKAHNNLGCVLEIAGRLREAERSYDRALELEPALVQARFNRGVVRRRLGDRRRALADIAEAVAREPGNAAWHCRLGELQFEEGQLEAALRSFRMAAQLDAGDARALAGLGAALLEVGEAEEAKQAFVRAAQSDPANAWLESRVLETSFCTLGDDGAAQLAAHRSWDARHARALPRSVTRSPEAPADGRRLRIGYLGPDAGGELVGYLMEALLAVHDSRVVEVFCYATSGREDEQVARMRRHACVWRDIGALDDLRACDLIRADGIDVLVDLVGHGARGRPLLLARKPAPVVASWAGYPGTTGIRAVDYRITDAVADPADVAERWNSERLLRLPGGHLGYHPPPHAPEIGAPAGLGPNHVTFACFARASKVTPVMIEIWARLLLALPGARMIFQAHGYAAQRARERLVAAFGAHGIAAERIAVLPPEASHARHLARYDDVDVALDTFPFNGRATTCEALWMGVPVVTLAGQTCASRTGASLLTAAGLPQLIASSAEQYLDIALEVARDVAGRHALRRELRARLRASALLDIPRLARELEAAYREMVSQRCADAPGQTVREHPLLRLHIGGKTPMPGWKIFNIAPGPDVDYVGDCARDLGQFADGSVAEIYASHVLEHLGYQKDLPHALAEFHRILAPGGVVRISVPDLEVLCRLFLAPGRTAEQRFTLMRMMFGGQMDEHDFHRVGLTEEYLRELLGRAGFSQVLRVDAFGLFDDSSTVRFEGVPISLNVIARK